MSAPIDVQPESGASEPDPTPSGSARGGRFLRGAGTKPQKPQKAPRPAAAPRAGRPPRAARGGATTVGRTGTAPVGGVQRGKAEALVVGREPRVDLLPNEVHVDRRERALARRVWLGVVVVALLVVLAITGATVNRGRSATQLAAAQASTQNLLLQQQKYAEVRQVERDTALAQAGQQVGGSTEIDWQSYLTKLQGALPAGVTINSILVDSASPIEAYAQSTIPLEGARVATFTIGVTSSTLPSVPALSDALATLPGYVDSTISQVSRDTTTSGYAASFVLHVNATAYDGAYAAPTTEK